MNRRTLLFSASTFAGLPFIASSNACAADPHLSLEAAIRKLFRVPEHAVGIGVRYLQTHPEKSDRRALMSDLLGPEAAPLTPSHSLATLVAQWQERDFGRGAVVVLDGWVLARTEVSLCALLCLEQPA